MDDPMRLTNPWDIDHDKANCPTSLVSSLMAKASGIYGHYHELMVEAATLIEQQAAELQQIRLNWQRDNRINAELRDKQAADLAASRAEVERLRGALGDIEAHWTQADANSLAEWEGEGTRAFEDVGYMHASSIKPLCDIARAALTTPAASAKEPT